MELGDITFMLFLAIVFLLFQNNKNRKNIEKLMNPHKHSDSHIILVSFFDAANNIIRKNPNIDLDNKKNRELYSEWSNISLSLLVSDNMWIISSRKNTHSATYWFSDFSPIYVSTLAFFNDSKTKKPDSLHELRLEIYQRINKQVEGMPPPEPYLSICLVEYNHNIAEYGKKLLVSANWPIRLSTDPEEKGWKRIIDDSFYRYEKHDTVFGTKEYDLGSPEYEKNGISVHLF